jgi:drug/metabolite transporter (DMT)-like permease
MFAFYFSITLVICSVTLYQFTAKSTPTNVNFAVSLLVTYAIAFIATLFTFYFFPIQDGLTAELKRLNWASVMLGVAALGIELGFLLTYRAGWSLAIAGMLVSVIASLLLIPVAVLVFKDKISSVNVLGIFVCFAGLVMLNWRG